MESKLCMNCFAEYHPAEGPTCPVCGWDNARLQLRSALRYQSVLSSRYVTGRAKTVNGEGITYAGLDRATKRVVEIREFFPGEIAVRHDNGQVSPAQGHEEDFARVLRDHVELVRGVSRLRELSVVTTVLDIFEENGTVYSVYEYAPTLSLRRYVENHGGRLSWNDVNRLFGPVLSAMSLIRSLGISHLGLSPDTLRVTSGGTLLITGFSVADARRTGSVLRPELFPGCAALEQYRENAPCGEVSDVYGCASAMLYALTGSLPLDALQRRKDPRLMIPKEVMKALPPYTVTAIANALQIRPEDRSPSFERFRSELSSAPTVQESISETEAIRRIPGDGPDTGRSRGLPPVVWLIGSLVVTFAVLFFVANHWLGERGMSFMDLKDLFTREEAQAQTLEVPNLINQSYDLWAARTEEGLYNFQLKVSTRIYSETVEEGNIISQSPLAGETIAPGETVLVTVSKGSSTRTLPQVQGMSFAELNAVLTRLGFSVVQVEEENEDIALGYVIRYADHQPGDSLDVGAAVTVVVSAGWEEEE